MGNKKSKNIVDIVLEHGKKAQKTVSKQAGIFASQVKDVAADAADKAVDVKEGVERFMLKPITVRKLKQDMPKIIRITEHDLIHESSPVCKRSIGFRDDIKGKSVFSIYTRFVDKTGIDFYPNDSEDIYLSDPYDDNKYIACENYYSFLQKEKLSELTNIAQDLGAKYIKITWEEEEKTLTKKGKKASESASTKIQGSANVSYSHSGEEKSHKEEKVLYDSDFNGSTITTPVLKYFKSDSQIRNLIKGRMHQKNPLKHQKLILEQKSTCGIKINDAVAVDAALKKYDLAKGKSFVSFKEETEREYRSKFIYEIDF